MWRNCEICIMCFFSDAPMRVSHSFVVGSMCCGCAVVLVARAGRRAGAGRRGVASLGSRMLATSRPRPGRAPVRRKADSSGDAIWLRVMRAPKRRSMRRPIACTDKIPSTHNILSTGCDHAGKRPSRARIAACTPSYTHTWEAGARNNTLYDYRIVSSIMRVIMHATSAPRTCSTDGYF